jgi:hypothetical protein
MTDDAARAVAEDERAGADADQQALARRADVPVFGDLSVWKR